MGLSVDRTDPDWLKLMDFLDGHPLAMRVVLPRLQKTPPGPLMRMIESNLVTFNAEDQESAKLFASLEFAREGLPRDLQALLTPLALHERFVHANILKVIAQRLNASAKRGLIDRLVSALTLAGLLRDWGEEIYEMHPALGRFLRLAVLNRVQKRTRDAWCRAFVDVMGDIADYYGPQQLHGSAPHSMSGVQTFAQAWPRRSGWG